MKGAAADVLPESLKLNRRGPIVGRCPPVLPGQEVYCCKCPNEDPAAAYDFDLMITLVRNGNLMKITQFIPLDNGELLIAERSSEYSVTIRDEYVSKIKSASSNFGAVKINKDEVSKFYTHFVLSFFSAKTRLQRFSADYALLEEKEVSGFKFPLLPGERAATERPAAQTATLEPQYFELAEARANDRIRFTEYKLLENGDYEVDGGEEFNPIETEAPLGVQTGSDKPPGLYIELAIQEHPPFIATIYWLVDESGTPRFLSGVYCTQVTYGEMREWVFKKKKKSWFRKKTRITVIRKELRIERAECHSIDGGPR